MKIIQLIQKPQLRGAEIFACQLSNHLLKQGHQVLVVSIFQGDAELPFTGNFIELNRSITKRFFDITGWNKFSKIVKDFNADIIQANAADTLKFAVSSKLLFSWKNPVVFRNANKMGDFINTNLKWKLNKFYLSKVSYVISVSKECEKDLISTFSFSPNKIRTVEIGVEDKKLGGIPDDLKEVFRKGPVISHIGGFVTEKNHSGLIKIFEQALREYPNAQLLLMGKGKQEKIIKEKVKKLNIERNVHFLGYRNDVLNILTHSKVFVLPSLIEGLPAVLLEAMYCETPVVAYNVGGISEVVIPDKTGWLINKGEENDFVIALNSILKEGAEISEKIRNAKTLITQKFSNLSIGKRFTECYKEVVGSDKMKVLQLVTKRQYRGAELFASDLSNELIKLGHEVFFVGLYQNNNDILTVENADNRDLVKNKKKYFSIKIVKKIVEFVNEVEPDIIQCNGSDTLKYTVAASYFFKKDIPLVYRNISIISEWISSLPKKLLYKRMFNRIAHVTSVGDEALADFVKTYKYPQTRAEVIRRGVPVKGVNKSYLSKKLKKDLKISNNAKIAIHVGNFSPEKNHEFLLTVFAGLKEEYPNIKLVCVGSGVLFEEIKHKIYKMGLKSNIFLLGFRKDIPELLSASDCLVLSSNIEGVPGVILEAGTQKIPSIAINVGGVSEVLINEVTGYLIEDFDVDEFRKSLLELMTNDDKRKEFGENAYSMISKGFDPAKNAEKFEKLYSRLIVAHKRK